MNQGTDQSPKWLIFCSLAIILLAVIPQLSFVVSRHGEWHGAYSQSGGLGDEAAYSAYIQALIDGRPRRSDPYTGRDDRPGRNEPESLFSIQCVPAYLIALPSRALGINASTAFIALRPLAALAAALAVFWLLFSTTGDRRLASAGTIAVLCLGTFVPLSQGKLTAIEAYLLNNYLPFLRLYMPAAPFPLFWILAALVWHSFASQTQKRRIWSLVGAGVVFDLLIFSYFYLWTAAAAWLVCLAILWSFLRRDDFRKVLTNFGTIGLFALPALMFYGLLLSHRAQTVEGVQLLALTHRPDLWRGSEILAGAVLIGLLYLLIRRKVEKSEPLVLFALSLALMPFIVFNQQVVTGRSLQPFHYEMFIANYAALVAMVLAIVIVWRACAPELKIADRRFVLISFVLLDLGLIATIGASRATEGPNRLRDNAVPAFKRLAEFDRSLGTSADRPVVLSTDLQVGDELSTTASQAILWAPHMLSFSGASDAEMKERFYQYLYYTGVDRIHLREGLVDPVKARYGFVVGIFGWGAYPWLSSTYQSITDEQVTTELSRYSRYVEAFTRERAASQRLSYLLVLDGERPDLSNLDRWYHRDAGEIHGDYVLYRLTLRN
jgi:hypothetical protein